MVTVKVCYPLLYYPGLDNLFTAQSARFRGRVMRSAFDEAKQQRVLYLKFPNSIQASDFQSVQHLPAAEILDLDMEAVGASPLPVGAH